MTTLQEQAEAHARSLRAQIAAHEAAWSDRRDELDRSYERAVASSIRAGAEAEFATIFLSLRKGLKHLNATGMATYKHSQTLRILARAEIEHNPALAAAARSSLERTGRLLEKTTRAAQKWARDVRLDVALNVAIARVPASAGRKQRELPLWAGIRAEHRSLVDRWLFAIETVARDPSTESILGLTSTLLETIDLPSHVPRLVERLGESGIARVGRKIDAARSQYVSHKNQLKAALRAADELVVAGRHMSAIPGFSWTCQ